MISHKHKCIFIHIPKTGGMTIEHALLGDDFFKKLHNGRTPVTVTHGTPIDWKYPKKWNEYFTFTFVRNPWDRLVSAYFHDMSKRRINTIPARRKVNNFLKSKNLGRNDFIPFVKKFLNFKRVHYMPCNYWFKKRYNFVGRFENLQADFDTVCEELGIPKQKLSHKNKSEHKHYTEYYDDEAREIVAKKYAKDIKRFGYEFGS